MKKRVIKKSTKVKSSKSKKVKSQSPVSPVSASADQDVLGLLTVLVQKLTSFESKIDLVLSRIPANPGSSAQTSAAPKPQMPQTQAAPLQNNKPNREPRPMYKAVCGDCSTDCEVPFKPKEGRPVYCKECFAKRKAKNVFKPAADKPREVLPAQPVPVVPAKEAASAKALPKKHKAVAKKKKPGRK